MIQSPTPNLGALGRPPGPLAIAHELVGLADRTRRPEVAAVLRTHLCLDRVPDPVLDGLSPVLSPTALHTTQLRRPDLTPKATRQDLRNTLPWSPVTLGRTDPGQPMEATRHPLQPIRRLEMLIRGAIVGLHHEEGFDTGRPQPRNRPVHGLPEISHRSLPRGHAPPEQHDGEGDPSRGVIAMQPHIITEGAVLPMNMTPSTSRLTTGLSRCARPDGEVKQTSRCILLALAPWGRQARHVHLAAAAPV